MEEQEEQKEEEEQEEEDEEEEFIPCGGATAGNSSNINTRVTRASTEDSSATGNSPNLLVRDQQPLNTPVACFRVTCSPLRRRGNLT